jgi:hypothetical protein
MDSILSQMNPGNILAFYNFKTSFNYYTLIYTYIS